MRRFGCIAYIKLPKTDSKFSNVSLKTVLVGYTSTGYTLWHPTSRKFLESRHVRFLERLMYKDVYKNNQIQSEFRENVNSNGVSRELINFTVEEKTERNSETS